MSTPYNSNLLHENKSFFPSHAPLAVIEMPRTYNEFDKFKNQAPCIVVALFSLISHTHTHTHSFYLRQSRQVLELWELLVLLLWGGSSLSEHKLAAYCIR